MDDDQIDDLIDNSLYLEEIQRLLTPSQTNNFDEYFAKVIPRAQFSEFGKKDYNYAYVSRFPLDQSDKKNVIEESKPRKKSTPSKFKGPIHTDNILLHTKTQNDSGINSLRKEFVKFISLQEKELEKASLKRSLLFQNNKVKIFNSPVKKEINNFGGKKRYEGFKAARKSVPINSDFFPNRSDIDPYEKSGSSDSDDFQVISDSDMDNSKPKNVKRKLVNKDFNREQKEVGNKLVIKGRTQIGKKLCSSEEEELPRRVVEQNTPPKEIACKKIEESVLPPFLNKTFFEEKINKKPQFKNPISSYENPKVSADLKSNLSQSKLNHNPIQPNKLPKTYSPKRNIIEIHDDPEIDDDDCSLVKPSKNLENPPDTKALNEVIGKLNFIPNSGTFVAANTTSNNLPSHQIYNQQFSQFGFKPLIDKTTLIRNKFQMNSYQASLIKNENPQFSKGQDQYTNNNLNMPGIAKSNYARYSNINQGPVLPYSYINNTFLSSNQVQNIQYQHNYNQFNRFGRPYENKFNYTQNINRIQQGSFSPDNSGMGKQSVPQGLPNSQKLNNHLQNPPSQFSNPSTKGDLSTLISNNFDKKQENKADFNLESFLSNFSKKPASKIEEGEIYDSNQEINLPLKQILNTSAKNVANDMEEDLSEKNPFNDQAEEFVKCLNCEWIFPENFTTEEKNAHMDRCFEGKGEEDRRNYLCSLKHINSLQKDNPQYNKDTEKLANNDLQIEAEFSEDESTKLIGRKRNPSYRVEMTELQEEDTQGILKRKSD